MIEEQQLKKINSRLLELENFEDRIYAIVLRDKITKEKKNNSKKWSHNAWRFEIGLFGGWGSTRDNCGWYESKKLKVYYLNIYFFII